MTVQSPHILERTGTIRRTWKSRSADQRTADRAALVAHRAEKNAAARAKARKRLRGAWISALLSLFMVVAIPAAAWAAEPASADSNFIQVALYMGALSLLPFMVMSLTSFLRIVVVLSFLRSGLGAQNVPPNVVIISLALFLSLFVMGPTIDKINNVAFQPLQAGKINFEEAVTVGVVPLKKFMADQLGASSKKEVQTFYKLAAKDQQTPICKGEDFKGKCLPSEKAIDKYGVEILPIRVIIPAFIISELKKAFIMGFAVLLPFLVIDLLISNILQALGMFMLPPVVISLPFKILLFVLAGGWTMVVDFLIAGFNY